MLVHLNIKNFALIEQLTLEPENGLNILTGETGAGKTIVLDALGLILGGRASSDYIRSGCDKAIVQGVFQINNNSNCGLVDLLNEWEIPVEEDGNIILTREIGNGKSIARINDQVVILSKLKELGKHLVDIHGQHDHQSLLQTEKHLDLLDAFGGEELLLLRKQIEDFYLRLQDTNKQLEQLIEDPRERARKLELLEYQQQEIEEAKLSTDEEQQLYERRIKLQNIEKLRESIGFAYAQVYEGEDHQPSMVDNMGYILDKLNYIKSIDENTESFYQQIDQLMIQMQELSRELKDYLEEIDINPMELQEIEKRIDIYNELKRKYGNNVDEINDYLAEVKAEIDYLKSTEEQRTNLEKHRNEILQELDQLSSQLTNKRQEIKNDLEKEIMQQLQALAMEKVQFEVKLEETMLSAKGKERAEFMFSPNKGEPVKSLVKIASGGELARVMLALKTLFSSVDDISTLVFDEVDTGISGNAAQKVATKLYELSLSTQVLCVTHLPQVASKADNHYRLVKRERDDRTTTEIEKLSYEQRIRELAEMIDGEKPSKTSLEHAENLITGSK